MNKKAIILSLFLLLYLILPHNVSAVDVTVPDMPVFKDASDTFIEIPVDVDYAIGLAGFQMTLTYDPNVLESQGSNFGELTPMPQWSILQNTPTAGQIIIGGYDTILSGTPIGSGSLIKPLFKIKGRQGVTSNINLNSVKLSDIYGNEIYSKVVSGQVHIMIVDNDGDGIPNDIDKCPYNYDPAQADSDNDGIGNACDQCTGPPIMIGSTTYNTLQSAYDAAQSGSAINIQFETLYQNLLADKNKSVILEGGYNCTWTYPPSGLTVIKGEINNRQPSSLTLRNVYVSTFLYWIADCSNITGLGLNDYDSDGKKDACDPRPADSNLTCDRDTDGDGMSDSYEIQYGLNRSDAFDRDLDYDGDYVTNYGEFLLGTDPLSADSDNDGYFDGEDSCPLNNCSQIVWTDNPIQAGTIIKAQHILELRYNINLIRTKRVLAPYQWTNPILTPGSSLIKAEDITDLRRALNDVLTPDPAWAIDPNIVRGTVIQWMHIQELRNAVENAW
jgi:hypothetical protein